MNRQQRRKLQRIEKRNHKKKRLQKPTFRITKVDQSNMDEVLDKMFGTNTVCERIQDAKEKGIYFSQHEIDLMHKMQAEIDYENELQLKKITKMIEEDKKCP